MRSANWFSLIKVILKHGALTIPSHDYEKSRKVALEGISDQFITTENSGKRDLSLAKPLLSLPIIGPLVAFISYYKTQLQWPTYVYHWPKKSLPT